MRKIIQLFALLAGMLHCHADLAAQCNRCLDFDGNGDRVARTSTFSALGANFTVEMWFQSTATGTVPLCELDNFRRLFTLSSTTSPNTFYSIGECNDGLVILQSIPSGLSAVVTFTVVPGSPAVRGVWRHLAVVRIGPTVDIYVDGSLIYTDAITVPATYNRFHLGSFYSGVDPVMDWLGEVDEVRIWSLSRMPADILAQKNCPLAGNETGLWIYWRFDQGIPGGNNTAFTQVEGSNDTHSAGNLLGFGLNGASSNFVTSTAPLIEPYFAGTDLEIRDYPWLLNLQNTICNDDPLHFCLKCAEEITSQTGTGAMMTWQLDDGSSTWSNISNPHFDGTCFAIPPGDIHLDCPVNALGYADWRYRAKFEVPIPGSIPTDYCTMYSDEAPLRICCPISDVAIAVSTNYANDLLCDNDNVDFHVTLSSPDAYIMNPGPEVTLTWYFNGAVINPSNSFDFIHNATVNAGTSCFKVVLTNCAQKERDFSYCIVVDEQPLCGYIQASAADASLEPDLSTIFPDDYFICPSAAGVLEMVDAAAFEHCSPTWQYSFNMTDWSDLGSTNPIQNTNILPSYLWPLGQDVIYYQIVCRPKTWPNSGCDPCFSNKITIQLKNDSPSGSITGDDQVCAGETSLLSFDNPQPGFHYQWFCNGLPVGTDQPTYLADMNACYWVEVRNDCPGQVLESNRICLEICTLKILVPCPVNLANEICIRPGDTITLNACGSYDTCGGALDFSWSASNGTAGTTGGLNNCLFMHTPDLSGTTYTVTATNSLTGCSKTETIAITPCENN